MYILAEVPLKTQKCCYPKENTLHGGKCLRAKFSYVNFPGDRLGRAKSEEQIGEILDEAKKEGLERDSVIAQSAAQQGNKLNTSATNGS